MSSDDPPSEVNENYPDFDYNCLQPPPEEWELYDIPDKTHLRNRALDLRTFKKLVKHHTWGIYVVIGERRTKERLLQVLKRIIFNQSPNLRPTWHEFISRNCDAGPRLLRRSYNALQISRNYPNGIPGESIYLQPSATHHQPQLMIPHGLQPGAFTHGPIGLLRQPGYPAFSHGGPNIPQPRQMEFHSGPIPDQNRMFEHGHSRILLRPNSDIQQSSVHNLLPHNPNTSPPYRPVSSIAQSTPSRNQTASSASARSVTEQRSKQLPSRSSEVFEAVERTIMSFPYRKLHRHRDAPPSTEPVRNLVATSNVHLALNTSRTESTISHIQAIITGKIPIFSFDPDGVRYPYHGRGPVSRHDTSAVDCAIVVGKLLDAGTTIADRGDEVDWAYRLTALENAFIDASNVNWDILSEAESANQRDQFQEVVANCFSDKGLSMIPSNVWAACTESFSQFHVRYNEHLYPCPCQRVAPTSSADQTVNLIAPDFQEGDMAGVGVAELFYRFFQCPQRFNCTKCGSSDTNYVEKRFSQLPWRLAVRPDQRTVLQSHSLQNITFEYTSHDGSQHQATYRWLGGIYCVLIGQEYHFRVYWNDNGRGEADDGALRFYDGTQLSGAIIGGLHATGSERIPPTWWVGGAPPVLFYEKVVNPEQDVLSAAHRAVQIMQECANSGRLILQYHRGWAPYPQDPNAKGQTIDRRRASIAQSFNQFPSSNEPRRPQHYSGVPEARVQSLNQSAVRLQSRTAEITQQPLVQRRRSKYSQQGIPASHQRQPSRSGNKSDFVAAPPNHGYESREDAQARQNLQQASLEGGSGVRASTGWHAHCSDTCSNVPELPPVTGSACVPFTDREILSDSIFSTSWNTGPSASTMTTSSDSIRDANTNLLPHRSRGSGSWATVLEECLTVEKPGVSHSYLDHLCAAGTTAGTEVDHNSNPQLPIGLANLPISIRRPGTATEIDDAGAWAFDFDAASAELPNLTLPATAPNIGTAAMTPTLNAFGNILQGYGEHPDHLQEPRVSQATGQAQARPDAFASEPGVPSIPAIDSDPDGDTGEKRKRQQSTEDGHGLSKRSKQCFV
ncbi:predicted protein [Uncinocarpus reesii 1704]|uniref:Uncharacterized protein n=1 Tax=Uncinocarpus reesii (strain UAMH 1704) TaxID=336963 RepID=C4JNL7_UNCRE|nr:uncharacterized protein UREG_03015 [Uncinocarpus reesii 1704]EEP78170.1 predicted protein [Uncinocarpus reesii 1704]